MRPLRNGLGTREAGYSMSRAPKNYKEYLRTVDLPHEIRHSDGELWMLIVSERDRREAMYKFRRYPAPKVSWTGGDDIPDDVKAVVDGERAEEQATR
jgi:hypothetical protein